MIKRVGCVEWMFVYLFLWNEWMGEKSVCMDMQGSGSGNVRLTPLPPSQAGAGGGGGAGAGAGAGVFRGRRERVVDGDRGTERRGVGGVPGVVVSRGRGVQNASVQVGAGEVLSGADVFHDYDGEKFAYDLPSTVNFGVFRQLRSTLRLLFWSLSGDSLEHLVHTALHFIRHENERVGLKDDDERLDGLWLVADGAILCVVSLVLMLVFEVDSTASNGSFEGKKAPSVEEVFFPDEVRLQLSQLFWSGGLVEGSVGRDGVRGADTVVEALSGTDASVFSSVVRGLKWDAGFGGAVYYGNAMALHAVAPAVLELVLEYVRFVHEYLRDLSRIATVHERDVIVGLVRKVSAVYVGDFRNGVDFWGSVAFRDRGAGRGVSRGAGRGVGGAVGGRVLR